MKFLFVALSITLFPDFYIWHQFVRGNGTVWNLLYWLPLFLIIFSMLMGLVGGVGQAFFMRLFFFLVLCVSIPKLIFTIVSLLGKGMGILLPAAAAGANLLGGLLAVIAIGGAVYGFTAGWKKLTLKEVAITSERVPQAFDGYRIVQLSDLHIATYHQSPETVEKLVEMVNALEADAVVFTGDLVNIEPNELDPFMETLSRLRAKDGVFSVMGNHDYCIYGRSGGPLQAKRNTLEVQERERAMGWDLLLNEHRILRRGKDSIALVGVENDGHPPFPAYADMDKALDGVHEATYKVLLSHDPSHWRRDVLPKTNIDLTLSGHTHSMQFRIGTFSPSMWTYDEWSGLYQEGDRSLYVNTGTGSNVSFRLGAWPEITLLTLRAK